MSEPKDLTERVAAALDANYNPDKYPIMSAMFRDYAATAIAVIDADREGCSCGH